MRAGLERCGYSPDLILDGSCFQPARITESEGDSTLHQVAFTRRPTDLATAALGVVDARQDPEIALAAYAELAIPTYLVRYRGAWQWWSQRVGRPRFLAGVEAPRLGGLLAEQAGRLAPQTIYAAKLDAGDTRPEMEPVVDAELLPAVEEALGRRLAQVAVDALEAALEADGRSGEEARAEDLSTLFELITARALAERRVAGFQDDFLSRPAEVSIRLAGRGAGLREALRTPAPEARTLGVAGLEAAAASIAAAPGWPTLSPEALGSAFETARRSARLTSSRAAPATPPWLARYLVHRLSSWLEGVAVEEQRVLVPACGSGALLHAAFRALEDRRHRDGSAPSAAAPGYGCGLDGDTVALAAARLGLVLAGDGAPAAWDLVVRDPFASQRLGSLAQSATALLTLPPFERFSPGERAELARQGVKVPPVAKAAELLYRTLPHLPPGAVCGLVLPRPLLQLPRVSDLRRLLLREYEVMEIGLFPGRLLGAAEAEPALLLARKRLAPRSVTAVPAVTHEPRLQVAEGSAEGSSSSYLARPGVLYGRVREVDAARLRGRLRYSVEERVDPAELAREAATTLLRPDLPEIWEACEGLPTLGDLAWVAQGGADRPVLGSGGKGRSRPRPRALFPRGEGASGGRTVGEVVDGVLGRFLRFDRRQQIHQLPPQVTPRSGRPAQSPSPGPCPGGGGVGQVLVNRLRLRSHGPWPLRALLDPAGHPVGDAFLTVRPEMAGLSLHFLWALLNSPLAQAWVQARVATRHVSVEVLKSLPVPAVSAGDTLRVRTAARAYLVAARRSSDDDPVAVAAARQAMLDVDAEVLRLYGLAPTLERRLLETFAGWPRPGVPFPQERYSVLGLDPETSFHRAGQA